MYGQKQPPVYVLLEVSVGVRVQVRTECYSVLLCEHRYVLSVLHSGCRDPRDVVGIIMDNNENDQYAISLESGY